MRATSDKRIFDIRADRAKFPDKWFLDEPLAMAGDEIDEREFAAGIPYAGPLPAVVPVYKPGKELAFNLGAFDMPVVSAAVADIICHAAGDDVECFPVTIPGARGSYRILNAVYSLDCLDEQRSEFTRWRPGDHRSDLLGQYRMISTIRIDPRRTGHHHVFRIKNWPIALLVSNTIKDALITIPDLGIVFEPAS
jgi:hypothetical protein